MTQTVNRDLATQSGRVQRLGAFSNTMRCRDALEHLYSAHLLVPNVDYRTDSKTERQGKEHCLRVGSSRRTLAVCMTMTVQSPPDSSSTAVRRDRWIMSGLQISLSSDATCSSC